MSPIAYRCGSRVRMCPSTLTNPRSSSAVVVVEPDVLGVHGAAGGDQQQLRAGPRSPGRAVGPDGDPDALVGPRATDAASKRAFVTTVMPRRLKVRSSSLLTSRSSSGHDRRQVLEQRSRSRRGRGTSTRTRRRRPRRRSRSRSRAACPSAGRRPRSRSACRRHEARERLHPRPGGEDHVRRVEDALAAGAWRAVLADHLDADRVRALERAAALDPRRRRTS